MSRRRAGGVNMGITAARAAMTILSHHGRVKNKRTLQPHDKKIQRLMQYCQRKIADATNDEKIMQSGGDVAGRHTQLDVCGGRAGDAAATAALLRTKSCGTSRGVLEMIALLDAYVSAYSLDDPPPAYSSPRGDGKEPLRLRVVYKDKSGPAGSFSARRPTGRKTSPQRPRSATTSRPNDTIYFVNDIRKQARLALKLRSRACVRRLACSRLTLCKHACASAP